MEFKKHNHPTKRQTELDEILREDQKNLSNPAKLKMLTDDDIKMAFGHEDCNCEKCWETRDKK